MTRLRRLVFRASAVALLTEMLAGCASSSSAPADVAAAKAREVRTIDNRLQGSWRLVDYRPEVSADPMFSGLLATQLGLMIVRFDHGRLYADSPSFHVVRDYQIVDVAGPYFTVQSPDVGTAFFATKATLADDDQQISFRGDTDPWRGSGTLVRVR